MILIGMIMYRIVKGVGLKFDRQISCFLLKLSYYILKLMHWWIYNLKLLRIPERWGSECWATQFFARHGGLAIEDGTGM